MTQIGPTLPIPDDLTPVGRRAFCIELPDDPQHIKTALGTLLQLTHWFNWDRDVAHSGKILAELYSQILDSFGECAMTDVRQDPIDPCILDKQLSDGSWTEFANLQLCPPLLMPGGTGILWRNPSGEWVPIPTSTTSDPRFDYHPPAPWPSGTVPPGQSAQCLSAANNKSALKECINNILAVLTAGGVVLTVVSGIAGILAAFIPIDWLGAFIVTLAGGAVTAGQIELSAAFTDAVYHDYQCILDCNAEPDGRYTKSDWQTIRDNCEAHFTGVAQTIILAWLDLLGSAGLTSLGKPSGIVSADCGDCGCGWTHTFFFDVTDYASCWSIHTAPGFSGPFGHYVTGAGYEDLVAADTTHTPDLWRACGIETSVVTHITYVRVEASYTGASFGVDTGNQSFVIVANGSTVLSSVNMPAHPSFPLHWSGNQDITHLNIGIVSGETQDGSTPGGSVIITKVVISGTGTDPFALC